MIDSDTLSELVAGKRPSWIFTHRGMVQLYSREGIGTGLIVATSREAAEAHLPTITKNKSGKISIAKVGTVEGETLAGQLALAVLRHEATGTFVTARHRTLLIAASPLVRLRRRDIRILPSAAR